MLAELRRLAALLTLGSEYTTSSTGKWQHWFIRFLMAHLESGSLEDASSLLQTDGKISIDMGIEE